MRQTDTAERTRGWIVDYSIARAKAIEWLGDRYLLAKPVNRLSTTTQPKDHQRLTAANDPQPRTIA